MSDISEKLFWQIGQYSSAGNKYWRPEHQNVVSYLIQTIQSLNGVEAPVMLAIVAEPVSSRNSPKTKEVSQIVVDTIAEAVASGQAPTIPARLALGFDLADQRIHTDDLDKLEPIVCAVAAIVGQQLYVASCGHCRIFLIRDGMVRQVSIAHTLAEKLFEFKYITPEELVKHPYTHGPYRALGFDGESSCDMELKVKPENPEMVITADQALSLRINDIILVCSAMFYDFLEPVDWQLLTEYFGQPDKDIQTLVDNYAAAARPMERYFTRDITILALRLIASKSGNLRA